MSLKNENKEPRKIRCLSNKDDFFNSLMSKEKPNDCAHTIKEQISTEQSIREAYEEFLNIHAADQDQPCLNREDHVKFLFKGLRNLPSSFECLDSSRPWICYWILHALYLLDASISEEFKDKIINFLDSCQNETGGFGGGPDQISHLATTYAAINALCTLNCDRAFKIIKRESLLSWLRKIKLENGAFRMHEDGEEDVRGTYCAITVAILCNLDKIDPKLFDFSAEWILSCQTYEGGFGATPQNEAHGGYTFCALAALKLLGKEDLCDIDTLTYWLANKQMKFEGGFQGRTNKLVDSCYSFWQAGSFPIIQTILMKQSDYLKDSRNSLFDRCSLQEYILICCQAYHGGLIDKPGKNRDYYHSCYALSGLSIAQNYSDENIININPNEENLLNKTHPIFNINPQAAFNAFNYFSQKPKVADLEQVE